MGPSGLLHTEYCLLGKWRNGSKEICDRLNHHFQAGLKPIEKKRNNWHKCILLLSWYINRGKFMSASYLLQASLEKKAQSKVSLSHVHIHLTIGKQKRVRTRKTNWGHRLNSLNFVNTKNHPHSRLVDCTLYNTTMHQRVFHLLHLHDCTLTTGRHWPWSIWKAFIAYTQRNWI